MDLFMRFWQTKPMRVGGRFLRLPLWIVLVPLAILTALVAMLLVLLLALADFVRLRVFCLRRGVSSFLVVSPRHGWHELVANNVAPHLPAYVELIWTSGPQAATGAARLVLAGGTGQAKPYLAQVQLIGIRVRSLHNRWHRYKTKSMLDSATQQALSDSLQEELQFLQGRSR